MMAASKRTNLEENSIFLLIGDYLHEKDYASIQDLIAGFHPADIAFLLNLLQSDDAQRILFGIKEDLLAEVIPDLNESLQQYAAENLKREQLSQVINEMDSDDAADLVGLMEKPRQEKILKYIQEEDALEVRELLQHGEETAGGLMQKEVVAIEENALVERAISEIRKAVEKEDAEQVYNVFVVSSDKGELLGTLPLNALVLAKPSTRVSELMEETRSVQTTMDQEDVARIARKYDMVEVPVVDDQNRLVGRITHDDILDVIEEEAVEDIGKMAGTGDEGVFGHSTLEVSRKRLTWLVIGLFGGVVAAVVMSRFESALGEFLALAFFIPVIMAMGGIVGLQCSTITVRGLATGEILHGQMGRRVLRELTITLITGICCSCLLTGLIVIWKHQFDLGLVVGGAMLSVMLLSTLSGTLIPVTLDRMKIDPAIATGPFVTTLNDIMGLTVYFFFTTFILD